MAAVTKGLHVQALTAVELRRLWEEQHKERKKDAAETEKALSELRKTHGRLCQQVKGEVSKAEYLAAKAAAVQQRDSVAARISELEATLDNAGNDGQLQNGFVSAFEKHMGVEEITSEITSEVLKEVRVHPGGRFEIIWNLRDELEKLVLDLQGDHQDER